METMTVPGCSALIHELDAAVAGAAGAAEATTAVQECLSRLILDRAVWLPPELTQPVPGHYARRLVHKSPDHGYSVVAMVWGPGQSTPLHDHAGTWCVEGVYQGRIEVTQYNLLESEGDLCRFERAGSIVTGVGTAGSLIPPYEYHTIANPRPEASITLHVYGGELTSCAAFEPVSQGWYRKRRRELTYDA
jgi:predicted metal-dependent enzyme (double-stranded beta helix superfamily)